MMDADKCCVVSFRRYVIPMSLEAARDRLKPAKRGATYSWDCHCQIMDELRNKSH